MRYIDGCFSNNLPEMDEHTITVTPFCGEADICPKDNTAGLVTVYTGAFSAPDCFVENISLSKLWCTDSFVTILLVGIKALLNHCDNYLGLSCT